MSRYEILPMNDSDSLKLVPKASFGSLVLNQALSVAEKGTHLFLADDQKTVTLYLPIRVKIYTTAHKAPI